MYANNSRIAAAASPITLSAVAFITGVLLAAAAARTTPVISLVLLSGLVVAAVALIYPSLALLLTVSMIPLERIGRLTPDSSQYTVSAMRIVGLVALASFLIHGGLNKWKVKFGTGFLLYAAYCAWAITTVFFTDDQLGGIRAASAVLGNLLFFFLVVNLTRNWHVAKAAAAVWLMASVAIGVYTAYEWHTGRYRVEEEDRGLTSYRFSTVLRDKSEWEGLQEVDRALGTTSSPAVYAINMILTVPFLLFFFRTEKVWLIKMAALLGCLIAVYNVLLTNTRAATIVVVGVTTLCVFRGLVRLRLRTIVIPVVFALLLLLSSPEAVYKRVLDLGNYSYSQSSTLQVRMAYWSAGARIIERHWFTGIGLGNQLAVPALANVKGPEESTVHNEYLETLIETGILGWLLFFSFVGLLLYRGYAAASLAKRSGASQRYWFLVASQIAMISVLVYAVQVDVFHFPLKGWWLVAGLTWSLHDFGLKRIAETAESS
jgi:O-antigen ligase